MERQVMLDLIKRIKTEPSVLFLGQSYMRSFSGSDCFYDAINAALCGDKAPTVPNYQNLWDHINNGRPLCQENFNQMYQLVCDLPTQEWLRSVLSMRWGMVFTSAVDSCLTHCVGSNFSFADIGHDKSRFRREYMSKSSLHGTYLFGAVDGSNGEYPPAVCDPKTMRRLKKRVNDRVSWIYDEILRDCGVLVIDGWDPEQDWLTFLLDDAGGMLYNSIFLFGATSQIQKNDTVAGLIEDKILTCYPQSFAQALEEHGYFESDNAAQVTGLPVYEGGKTVTIRSKRGQDISLSVPLFALDVLDSRITLLDDDLGNERRQRNAENRGEDFARYLQQSGTPVWPLCTLNAGFHFEREVDTDLWNASDELLRRNTSYRRQPLILEGVSNSGKTRALVHFGMRLREEHRYPVLYISGMPTQTNFTENLKNFIKRYLLDRQDSDGAWVDQVVVLWDGNLDSDTVRRYEKLSRDLIECNAVVIGTIYCHENQSTFSGNLIRSGASYLYVQATLNNQEEKRLGQLLQTIDTDQYERFRLAVERAQNPNLIYLLQQISKYHYSPEWKAVIQALTQRFRTEVDRSETNAQEAVQQYQDNLREEDVQEEIVKRGAGAAWQLQLEQYLAQMMKENEEASSAKETSSAEDSGRAQKEKLLNDVRKLNGALAMASQFSVTLPVSLLLNMLHHDGSILSKESLFLNALLMNDSLIEYIRDEQGYPFARFRHPKEAELYVEKNFGDDPCERCKQEVTLLCEMIAACHWNEDESYDIIALIRCFGPNSIGKYGQNITRGNYTEYLAYLPKIADCLKEYANDNPEATLVYAHFLRETYSNNQRKGISNSVDYLDDAKRSLRMAIENHDQRNRPQYNRLVVEVCSNLVASMPQTRNDGSFNREVFREFQNNFTLAKRTWDSNSTNTFNANALLDIWLNAAINFYNSFPSGGDALRDSEFAATLADSLHYIDTLFEINSDFNSTGVLSKIERIYTWSPSEFMATISAQLERQNNDTFLYLIARRCWLTQSNDRCSRTTSMEDIVHNNLFLLPDDADARAELRKCLPELKLLAIERAQNAIPVLENKMDLIRRSKSSRCLHMLIRAKWLVYTGCLPLEEKQQFALTTEQWTEIYRLCDEYTTFSALSDSRIQYMATLLQAVYLWSFTSDVSQARTLFAQLRQQMGNGWFIERAGLCVPGEKRLRTFYVDVQRTQSGKYAATIAQETAQERNGAIDLRGRYGIHISDYMLSYLFDGQAPCNRFGIRKPVVIWFNANGPTLGVVPGGKAGEAR